MDKSKDILDKMALDTKEWRPKVIAGDFNAWTTEWRSLLVNERGRCLFEVFA